MFIFIFTETTQGEAGLRKKRGGRGFKAHFNKCWPPSKLQYVQKIEMDFRTMKQERRKDDHDRESNAKKRDNSPPICRIVAVWGNHVDGEVRVAPCPHPPSNQIAKNGEKKN